ncbi:peroxisome biogenesis factor 1 [Skeletonema marinoi]|uniref:Peroxisome biogenesis factor 1 n=1 Tax=Skeletonema marinoi TaxID=267567 RepID=A0AAD9DGK4_9STRA|nr:peroxisome biogenesis factor 1 [Skeletonema marinoi]
MERQLLLSNKTLISSGCIIPSATLRTLVPQGKKDWLDQCCLFTLNLQSTTGEKSDRDDSHLGSVITADDLKYFLEREGQLTDTKSGEHGQNEVLPPADLYVEGFSSTIERLAHDVSKIISWPHSCWSSTHRNAMLLTGEVGSGKTHLALTLASHLLRSNSIGMEYLDCKMLQAAPGSTLSSILNEIQTSCHKALQKQPSLLILDDLDASVKLRLSSTIYFDIRAMWRFNVVLLCTCRDNDSLAARYKNSGIFYSAVEVPSLNSHQRTRLLHNLCSGIDQKKNIYHDIPNCISKLGKMTDGFRPHDLMLLSTRIRNSQHLRQIEHSSQERAPVYDDFTLASGKFHSKCLKMMYHLL